MAYTAVSNMAQAGCIMRSLPRISSSTSHFSSFSSSNAGGFNGISRLRIISNSKIRAKFEKFQGEEIIEDEQEPIQQVEEDDSCLPSDLEGAVCQSGQASAEFVSSGGMRAIVELLIPQFQFLDDEGAQNELWQMSKWIRLQLTSIVCEPFNYIIYCIYVYLIHPCWAFLCWTLIVRGIYLQRIKTLGWMVFG